MAICQVYSQSVSFKYKSTLCSKSAIFSLSIAILTAILPLLIAYRSHGFWIRTCSFREQPRISFKHRYLLYFETDLPDFPVLCSNLPVARDRDYCTTIKSVEEDVNQDGKYDRLMMNVKVDVPSNISIFSAQLILIFDYRLESHCLLQMESAGYVQFNSGLPFNQLRVAGELRLNQKQLLKSENKDTRYNVPVFGSQDDPSSMLTLQQAMTIYGNREVSTSIQNAYNTWSRGVLLNGQLDVSVGVVYPEDTIYYRPSFWQILKWAWIQYLALFIIFFQASKVVKSYVFANNLIPAFKEVPWKMQT